MQYMLQIAEEKQKLWKVLSSSTKRRSKIIPTKILIMFFFVSTGTKILVMWLQDILIHA